MRALAGNVLSAALAPFAAGAGFESRLRDIAQIFYPGNVASAFGPLGESLLTFAQASAVLFIVGGLLAKLRRSGAELEHIAGMVLLVGFISTVPVWRTLALEIGDAVADALGSRAVPTATLAAETGGAGRELSPLMLKIGGLAEQWNAGSSPFSDGLDGDWAPGDGNEEAWLGKGWNWSKPGVFAARTPAAQAWASSTAAERAGLLQRVVLGTSFAVHFTQACFYLAETLRWLLFHAGFALMPLMIAGLGTESFRGAALRSLAGVGGVALWPAGWAVANLGTMAMLEKALDILAKTAHAALYPDLGRDVARTLADAAPHLSWGLTMQMVAVTLALCFWMLATLVAVPVAAHLMLAAGVRRSHPADPPSVPAP